jgi:predicted nucleic acid-binding protein
MLRLNQHGNKLSELPGVGNGEDSVQRLKSQPILPPISTTTFTAIREHGGCRWEYADKRWTLTDCVSFVIMRERYVSEALTGDKHFEQAGFVALLK